MSWPPTTQSGPYRHHKLLDCSKKPLGSSVNTYFGAANVTHLPVPNCFCECFKRKNVMTWLVFASSTTTTTMTCRHYFVMKMFLNQVRVSFCLRPMAEVPSNYLSCSSGQLVNLLLGCTPGLHFWDAILV